MSFSLNARSQRNLIGVHPDLVKVVNRAAELVDDTIEFIVTEGARTTVRQAELVRGGFSRTMDSRHIPGADGLAKAVDLAPLLGGEVRWDWPPFGRLAAAMKDAAQELGVPLTWGGDWTTFKDGPHFELPKAAYP